MQGERTPNLPKDASNLLAFLTDGKAKKKWLEDANAVIERNEKLLATIGKASAINKLHAEAKN